VPLSVQQAILWDALAKVFMIVAGLLVIGFVAALQMGGAIGRSVRALCEPMRIPALHIREAAEVAAALEQVEQELQR
jgi:hypothetical protein